MVGKCGVCRISRPSRTLQEEALRDKKQRMHPAPPPYVKKWTSFDPPSSQRLRRMYLPEQQPYTKCWRLCWSVLVKILYLTQELKFESSPSYVCHGLLSSVLSGFCWGPSSDLMRTATHTCLKSLMMVLCSALLPGMWHCFWFIILTRCRKSVRTPVELFLLF